MIKIVLVEDHNVVRKGLADLFNKQEGMEVVGQVAGADEVLQLFAEGLEANLLISDLNLPEIDGIELTKRMASKFPTVKVVILTMHNKEIFVREAFEAGAKGYILKDGDFEKMVKAVRQVAEGNNFVCDTI
ncbi:response regulator [Olivibacter domesticus]|uniref:Response regulator receiver domain-containing protein n=1 Tax=Olivibacter domesticus TaxID=407022 RepID=A0A1H7KZH2_OLID1|nr:response regulator transcription factor [Olivibacter domesticus]SEK91950.1 Response regulator receiver domain-containing protein [Olivibacter domesticus]